MGHQFLYKRRKVFAVLVSITFIITSLFIPVHADNSAQNSISIIPPDIHSTDSSGKSIIVKYRDDKKSSFVKQAVSKKLNNYKINIKRNLGNIDIIDTSDEAEYQMVLHELKNNPYVEYAQPDYKLKKFEIDTEDLSSKQWGISNSGQTIAGQAGNSGIDINVSPVWDYTKGNESVIVGVLDTGIDISHPELKDSIYINEKEIPGNGEDDDHNGYIDDVNGWDFMNSDNTVYDNSEEDFHGTHIAGIIAAKHDNQGINGIAPNVKILPLKFLNLYNGFTSDAIEAIRYAKSMGVKVINCSFGDTNYNYALQNEMRESGILYVCASGNDGANLDTDPAYPVSFNIPNMITVAAVNNKGELCDFSNYGSAVDVAAPGENIISTIPEGKFDYASGTSMTAPFVTGAAALLMSFNPSYGPSKVKGEIKRSVKDLYTLSGKVNTCGIVNTFKTSLSGIFSYDNKVLTGTTDKINMKNFSSGTVNGYNFNDMIPLVDGWVIIGDIVANKVLILNVFSGEVSKEYLLNASPYKIDFNQEKGKIIATQKSSNNIALIDPYTDEIKYIPVSGNSLDVVFAKNNYAAAIISTGSAGWGKKISVLDWESGVEATSFPSDLENYAYLACNRATNNILVGDAPSTNSLTQFVFNEDSKVLKKKNHVMDMGRNGRDLVISPDGLHAAFVCGGGNDDGYTIFDIDATNISNKFGKWNTGPYPASAAFSMDSKYIITTNCSSIQLFDVTEHVLVETIANKSYTSSFSKVGISNGGKIAFAKGEDDKLYYYLISLPSTAIEPPTEISTSTPIPTPTPISEETPTLTGTATTTILSTPGVLNNTIKGTVHLPDNLTANEDIHIEVYLQNGTEKVSSTPVVIKEGTNLQNYTLLSPNASVDDKFQVGYCISEGGQSYAKSGIYSSAGTVFDEDHAENLVVVGNLEGIDMKLLVKRTISGKVSLPAGVVAPHGGVEVKLAAGYQDNLYYTSYVTIPEGQRSSDFKITAYANDTTNKYILEYSMEDMNGCFSYGYYNSSGTSIESKNASPIDISNNGVSNIQIMILNGRTISGIVKLPDNRTAPEGGIQVELVAENREQSTYYSRMVKIEDGKKSVGYSISVPDSDNSYCVSYYSVYPGFVSAGYYQGGNTVTNPDNANIIPVYGKHVSEINLALISGEIFKGSVLLPGKSVAPKGGIRVTVTAEGSNEDEYTYTKITIKEGCNSADYTFTVPLNNTGYTIAYYTEEKGYVKEGYYSIDSGMTAYYSQATKYNASSANDTQIVYLHLIEGTDITGEISLSSGTAPSGGTSVYIFLAGDSGIAAAQLISIPAGSSKAAYTITAPRYTNLYLGYILSSDKSSGFYSNGQTVYDIDFAESIYVGNETLTGKNMVIKFYPPTQPPIQTPTPTSTQAPVNGVGGVGVLLPEVSGVTATPTTTAITATPTPTATPSPSAKPTKESPIDNKPSAKAYKDITGHWAEQYVNKLQGLGVISGYEDNTIRPNKEISRAEAVVIICRAVGLKPAENFKLNFSDNNYIPNWAIGYVQTIVDKGILKGYPDNTFKPNAKITRAEVIALVINAFGLSGSPKAYHTFSDDKAIAPWAKNYIQNAFELGIVNGYKDNSIKPGNNISRAEMFVITAKCLDIKK